jgi:hypothetical protein
MQPYHDRMPVLLAPGEFRAWLDGSAGPELLCPAPESALREWLVSKRMNKTGIGDDDPTVLIGSDTRRRSARGLFDHPDCTKYGIFRTYRSFLSPPTPSENATMLFYRLFQSY